MRRWRLVLGAAGAVLGSGGVFTWWQTRRTEQEYPPAGRFVEVQGLRLHFVDRGPTEAPAAGADDPSRPRGRDAARTVVLIHGLRGSAADFELSILDLLAERYRVLAFDRPGSGYSDPAPSVGRNRRSAASSGATSGAASRAAPGAVDAAMPGTAAAAPAPRGAIDAATSTTVSGGAVDSTVCGPGSPLTQAGLLHGALRQLGVARPMLVAHSLGAALAMTYAVEYPDGLAGVVTLGGHALPFGGAIGGTSRIADVPLLGPLLVHTLITPLGLILGPRGLRRTMAPQEPSPAYTRAAVRIAIRPRAFFAAAADARECDAGLRTVYRRYGKVRVPVVALAGGADHVISPNESLTLSRLLPHAEYRELPGSGHMPFFADSAAVIAAIDRAWQLAEAAGIA